MKKFDKERRVIECNSNFLSQFSEANRNISINFNCQPAIRNNKTKCVKYVQNLNSKET